MPAPEKLAIDGGEPLRTRPFGPRWLFGESDKRQLVKVIANAHGWRSSSDGVSRKLTTWGIDTNRAGLPSTGAATWLPSATRSSREVHARETGGSRVRLSDHRPTIDKDGIIDTDGFGTSHVERHNLTLRTNNRRYTRRTNAYSKKKQNHMYQTALYAVWYNWIRPHSTLTHLSDTPTTPVMEAGLASRPFTLEELVVAIDAANLPGQRGPYGPRKKKLYPSAGAAQSARGRAERVELSGRLDVGASGPTGLVTR